MAEAPSSRDLRKEFPDMPFDGFLEIIKIFGDEDPEALRELLREQNEQARLMEEERQRTLRQRFEQITASMLHRKLGIAFPPAVNSEHASAIIVYGFAMPSSTRTFAGLNTLPIQYIRRDVQGKLGGVFREEHFKTAITYLRRNGVLIEPKSGTRGSEAYSLNINERAKGVTAEGREIIAAVKRFLHEHLPTRRK